MLFYKKLEEQQLKGPFVDAVTIADNVITNSHHSEPFLPKSMLESCMVVNANPPTSLSKTGEFPATQEEDEDGKSHFKRELLFTRKCHRKVKIATEDF